MTQALFKEKLRQSIEKLQVWIEENDYRGYEPFDGLASPLRPLTFNRLLLERVLQQLVRQSPINLRPILGIKPQDSTKGRGYMAWGYLQMFRSTGDPIYKEKARRCLDWLDQNKAPGYSHHSWGNHFDFSSRVGKLPKFDLDDVLQLVDLLGPRRRRGQQSDEQCSFEIAHHVLLATRR